MSPCDLSLPAAAAAVMSAKNTAPAEDGQELKSVVSRVASLALVSSACGAVSTAYTTTKESHPYVRSVCDAAEKGVKTLTAAAVSGAQPILTKLEPQISTANEYACKGLDKLEEKLPILQQPTERVVAGTRELVSSTVSGAVGLARGAVQGSVERTRSALSTGVSSVVGSRVGRLLATGVDAVLGKSEELVERYLPGTDEELAVAAAGVEVASPEWQRRWQSYFVRVGSLSAKLRHRALRRSLGELQRARHSALQVLAKLHHIFELIEQGWQGMDGPLYGTRQHLHRMWLEWSQQDAVPMEESEVEARTLAMLRGLLCQLHATCTRLVTSARSFPNSVQETAGHVRHSVEGMQASLSHAHSFHDLSGLVLAQSRETVMRAQLSIDELLEYVGQHAPLPWLVGPFAPVLVEYPEDVPVEMAKWEGCVTVGGSHHVATPPRLCSHGVGGGVEGAGGWRGWLDCEPQPCGTDLRPGYHRHGAGPRVSPTLQPQRGHGTQRGGTSSPRTGRPPATGTHWDQSDLRWASSTMATSEPGTAQPKAEEQQSIGTRVASLPLVSSAYGMVSTAYASTKESHPYVRSVCDAAEKGVKTLTAAAVSGAQPILTKLEPQISTANEYACKGLDKLEEKLPILQQPTEKLISDTKQLVTSTVTGAKDVLTSTVAGAKDVVTSRVTGVMDMTKGAVQGSVELTKSAVSSGVSTVMGSTVGQMVVSGMGSVLEKSEELVDHYLPMTDEELAKLATAVEGFETEQQKQQQSYFVRLGSLSTKLRHRALQHSLGKLQNARRSSQDVLVQLQRTLDLVEHLKQGMDQKLQGGQEKLQQMWLEWSKKQPGGGKDLVPPEPVESGTLAMLQGLTQQLQSSCQPLVSSLQGLPTSIQDTAGQVRQNVEELRASLASAASLQDVTSSVLAQARAHATKARQLMDELVEHVAHNTPLTWLVGPFAPSGQRLVDLEMK
ncbi:uncharacterized protein LOC134526473 [Chroicocephalus ridibundus]|uniref:uncharacterized protein LOC134526473 n=1 Tax=Chroicocephalus ridibundus TaxID=1192867 RepID=UPI002FDCA50C